MLRWAIELSEYRIDYQPRLSLKGQVMADFIAELPEARASDKEWTPNDWWSLHVDEVSRSSGSGVGLLLKALTGERLEQSIRLDFPTSNNEAEYEAILSGLELATTLNATKVKIHNKKAPRAIVVHMKEKFCAGCEISGEDGTSVGQNSECEISGENGTSTDRISDGRYPEKMERRPNRILDMRYPGGMSDVTCRKGPACRYAGKIGTVSGMGTALYKFKAFSVEGKSNTTSVSSPFGYCRRSDYRPFSQFVKSSGGRLFPVDTLAQIEMTQESNLSKFKSEVESSQGHHFSLLQHETKKLQSDMEKMHNKLRYETDDVTIAIRAEFAYHKAKTDHMYNKLDRVSISSVAEKCFSLLGYL
ncbi:hypothetical protein VitviT2T_005586 [Vitis vinifera]|uniref:RNase H type-1 domain-containing protein n=1 Tax=Vitis vinifera TaxID=29760 RepID=A0ABY9BU44_VITVI|nr:hypothetical protein VitviT2T_005586 [Vitis vinifera]